MPEERDLDAVTGGLLHAEDLRPHDFLELGSVSTTEEEIVEFARRFDPLPIHVDVEAATAGHFGGVIASAAHTLALYSSLASRRFIPRLALVAGKGIDSLRLPAPVRPATRLDASIAISEIRMRPERGTADVRCAATMTDEHGDVVLAFEAIQVVRRRLTRELR
ncbi:hypothetical protein K8Z61_12575 [Nocardioides sp. TRM66260-LWL]|uniref:MaoC/PaaZ C-terminal domain-containing protein n=1 Tax=Nocardioides sp. TRM66260-LWL TaxID=2874478 RepID=UPI001CC6A3B1|nr:MaoC/PaaZ C-terminal domain-containing protein [Nocardioides sp. TRM66260-LWL]MBZ5735331.1 hypothetical protein [Nocardioides sp. TRM66260-LWL]